MLWKWSDLWNLLVLVLVHGWLSGACHWAGDV